MARHTKPPENNLPWKAAAAAVALLAAGVGVGYALGRHGGSASGDTVEHPSAGPAVATFDGGELTADAVRARMAEEGPMMRDAYATPDGRRALVKQLVQEQVIALDAHKKGYDRDPRVLRQCDGALREVYLEREFEEPEGKRSIPDAELRAFYEKHRTTYERPERVRLARILLAAPAADHAARARQKAAATALLAELKAALAKDKSAFASAARKRSEDPRTRALGGELPMLAEAPLRETVGNEVAAAVFAEPKPAGLLPQVIESPEGFQLVQVLEREGAQSPSFEQVRELLQPRYTRERRDADRAAFLEERVRQAHAQYRDDAIDALGPPPASAPAGGKAPGR